MTFDTRTTRSIQASRTIGVGRGSGLAGSFGDTAFGGVLENGIITLQTDGTFAFGTKPGAEKTQFVWLADNGEAPDADKGRDAGWGSSKDGMTASGNITTEKFGPGSSQSVVFDHSQSEGAALGQVYIDTDAAYVFRRRFDDFTLQEALVMQIRVNSTESLTGEWPGIGMTITGQTSGAQTILREIRFQSGGRPDFYCDPIPSGQIQFTDAEVGTWDTGSADFRANPTVTFNNKTIRFWSDQGSGVSNINIYHSDNTPNTPGPTTFFCEHGAGSYNDGATSWDNSLYQNEVAREWVHDEYLFANSSGIDIQDGMLAWYRNGIKAIESPLFTTRTTARPNPIKEIVQAQVSGGAMPGFSDRYYDLLIIDDSWCRVVLLDGPDIRLSLAEGAAIARKVMPCPVITWASGQITCHDMQQYLPTATHIGVVNSDNQLVAVEAL